MMEFARIVNDYADVMKLHIDAAIAVAVAVTIAFAVKVVIIHVMLN